MKFSLPIITLLGLLHSSNAEGDTDKKKGPKVGKKNGKKNGSNVNKVIIPEIGSLIDKAFPMWEVHTNGDRVETKTCTVESCEWNPHYVTKRYDGFHPDFGGHPTDLDVKYAFFGSSPFGGQPYPGTPHHCDFLDDYQIKISECPKLDTLTDNGPYGPGHVPPHIALAALTRAIEYNLFTMDEIFDYNYHQCRVQPHILLRMIRKYYPRTEGEKVAYPSPTSRDGGDFQYEFPSGNGIDNQEKPYAPGPPHWCTEEFKGTEHWDGVCPYVFEGPDAGKYRHPHIAFAALEVYLAKKEMPNKCEETWLQNNPEFLDPDRPSTHTPFPTMTTDPSVTEQRYLAEMENDVDYRQTVEHWIGQPAIPWEYPPIFDLRTVEGEFAMSYYLGDASMGGPGRL